MFRMVNTYIGIFLCFVKFGSPILSYKQDKEFEIFYFVNKARVFLLNTYVTQCFIGISLIKFYFFLL